MVVARDFRTDVVKDEGATIILVRGELDIATCARLRDVIEPHLGPNQTIILDLSDVRFIDSTSLRVLEQARGTLTADGGSLMLRNPSLETRRMLSATGVEFLLAHDADENA